MWCELDHYRRPARWHLSWWTEGLKPLHALTFAGTKLTAYVGLIALVANAVTAVLVNFAMISTNQTPG